MKLYKTDITWKKSHKSRHEVKSGAANRITFKRRTLNMKTIQKIYELQLISKQRKCGGNPAANEINEQ